MAVSTLGSGEIICIQKKNLIFYLQIYEPLMMHTFHLRSLDCFLSFFAFVLKPPKQKSQTSLVFGMNALVPLGTIKTL